MSNIVRPPKSASGTRNYVPNTVILSAEVNADLNTIYDDYDGNITDFNISPSANIDPLKLDRSVPWVGTADIVDGAVTTAKVGDFQVTSGKLAVGATYVNNVVGTVPTSTIILSTGVTILDTPTFTSRGSTVILNGFMCVHGVMGGPTSPFGNSNTLTVTVYTGTPGPVFTPLASYQIKMELAYTVGPEIWGFPAVIPFCLIDTPAGGTTFYRVSAQGQFDTSDSVWSTESANAGFLSALQLA